LDRVAFGVKIRSETDLEVVRDWLKLNHLKAGKLRKILRKAKSALHDPDLREFVWLYPLSLSGPPDSLLRVQIELCSDSTEELYTQEAVSKTEYTAAEVESIVNDIKFGSNLSSEEAESLKSVVRKNIHAFSRSKGDLGYTTLIEHEIDLVHCTPVELRPFKLSFEEQRYAANYVQTLIKEG
jgi:hypothetical protein